MSHVQPGGTSTERNNGSGQAHPDPKTLGHMEVHERVFPHLGEYWGRVRCGQGQSAPRLMGESVVL